MLLPILTDNERKFTEGYKSDSFTTIEECAANAGLATSEAAIENLFARPAVARDLKDSITEQSKILGITRSWKLNKLKRVVDDFIPDYEDELDPIKVRVALVAMADINKLQGDYAPDKSIHVNANLQLDEESVLAQKIVEKLKKKYDAKY